MYAHLDGLPGNGLTAHGMVERPIRPTEVDKIMTIQLRGNLIENIVWDGVQTPGLVGHPDSSSVRIGGHRRVKSKRASTTRQIQAHIQKGIQRHDGSRRPAALYGTSHYRHGVDAWGGSMDERECGSVSQRGRASLIKLKKQSVEKKRKRKKMLCAFIFNYDFLWN